MITEGYICCDWKKLSHTEGDLTMTELDSLEMTKSSMWPPLWVTLFTCWVTPCEFKIQQNLGASILHLLPTWKLKSSIINTSKNNQIWKPFFLEGGGQYIIDTLTVTITKVMVRSMFSEWVYISAFFDLAWQQVPICRVCQYHHRNCHFYWEFN